MGPHDFRLVLVLHTCKLSRVVGFPAAWAAASVWSLNSMFFRASRLPGWGVPVSVSVCLSSSAANTGGFLTGVRHGYLLRQIQNY